MRGVFASFRFEPEPLQEPIVLGLQLHQRRGRRRRGDDSPRLAAAERGQSIETEVERLAMNAAKHAGDLSRQSVVDVADEAQRQMIVLRVDPTRSRQAAPHHGKRSGYCRRDFNSGEQAGHDNLRTRGSLRSGLQALLRLVAGRFAIAAEWGDYRARATLKRRNSL